MAFFLLSRISSQKTEKINNIVKKFDLNVSEYSFPEIDKVLNLFTWKNKETSHALKINNSDFICTIGTFIYKGYYGNDALTEVYNDFIADKFQHSKCIGHYNLILKKQNKLYMYTDLLGTWKIYRSSNGLISSSFYLLLALQENLSLNPQGVYEYVINGCTFGQKTICQQISRLEAEKYFIVSKGEALKSKPTTESLLLQPDYLHKSMTELTEDYCERLEKLFDQYKIIPARKFRSAISGGFDSRLILSAFLKTNTEPELYVYGKSSDKDVQVAKDVANTAKLELDFIDKSQLKNTLTKDNYRDIIERNLFMFDGLSYDGIFDNGNDYYDRYNRMKDNNVLVNGSVGEIFRHFYYINNKTISIKEFIKSFHSRFDSKAMSEFFNYHDYVQQLEQDIQETLHINSTELSRVDVESLYPLWRARYWSATDMVNNHRFGLALYPFFEASLISGTSSIKYEYKLYGRFEAQLIHALAPKLAGCESDYGFSFNEKPSFKYKVKTQILTYHRPVWLRALSYTLKHTQENYVAPSFLKHEYLSQVIDVNYPYMQRYFKQAKIYDHEMLNRLTSVEYIAEKFRFLR